MECSPGWGSCRPRAGKEPLMVPERASGIVLWNASRPHPSRKALQTRNFERMSPPSGQLDIKPSTPATRLKGSRKCQIFFGSRGERRQSKEASASVMHATTCSTGRTIIGCVPSGGNKHRVWKRWIKFRYLNDFAKSSVEIFLGSRAFLTWVLVAMRCWRRAS